MNRVVNKINNLKIAEHASRGLSWWLSELRATVPKSVEARWSGEKLNVLIRIQDDAADILLGKRNAEDPFSRFKLDGSDKSGDFEKLREFFSEQFDRDASVQVELSEHSVLVCEVYLPLATENNLSDVLVYEMDRLTPFAADQVGYAYRIVERFPERDRLKIELVLVRRDYLEEIVSSISRLGLAADAVYVHKNAENIMLEGQTADLNILPVDMRPESESRLSRKNKRLLGIFLAMLVLVVIYPLPRFAAIKENLEGSISAIVGEAERVGKKQRLLVSRMEGHELLTRKKNEDAAKIEVLRTLTVLVPEDTWISNLTVNSKVASLKGESDNASKLIEILEKDALFSEAKFISPVVRNPRSQKERFEIQVQLDGGSA
ncbi:MAG TPA: hypothetical protein DCF62_03660 [Porticoccaceae bacterium]|nr:hypothetical protein [Porticoccaceae bacterium]HCO60496.1 hypothetical protein [Porticoccaceae bacterium]